MNTKNTKIYFEMQGFLKLLILLWEYHYDIISNSLPTFTISINTLLESTTSD